MNKEIPEGYMENSMGHLVPIDKVKIVDQLRDGLVKDIHGKAAQIRNDLRLAKFDFLSEIETFIRASAKEHGAELGGQKGNVTLQSYDGRIKVVRSIGEDISFNEQLQAAKALIDECLKDWTKDSGEELKAVINNAFQVDKQGNISVSRILGLRRLNITDSRWCRAMEAIADSIQVVGTRIYVRIYERREPDQKWELVPMDLATV